MKYECTVYIGRNDFKDKKKKKYLKVIFCKVEVRDLFLVADKYGSAKFHIIILFVYLEIWYWFL